MNKKLILMLFGLAIITESSIIYAGHLNVPYRFKNGVTADANQMNANFDQIERVFSHQFDRQIRAMETQLKQNERRIQSLEQQVRNLRR